MFFRMNNGLDTGENVVIGVADRGDDDGEKFPSQLDWSWSQKPVMY